MGRPRNPIRLHNDAVACNLYARGAPLRKVAEALECSLSAASTAIKRGLAEQATCLLDKDEIKVLILTRIHIRYAECQEIIDSDHFCVAPGGKIATRWVRNEDGTQTEMPVLDPGPKLRALREQGQLDELLGKYADAEPPSKRRVETIERGAIEARIEELEADLGRNDSKPANRRARR